MICKLMLTQLGAVVGLQVLILRMVPSVTASGHTRI